MRAETRNAIIAWGISPILFLALGILILWLGTLSHLSSLVTLLLVCFYAVVTTQFFRMLYRFGAKEKKSWVRHSLVFAVIAPIGYFTIRQFSPTRILQSESPGGVFSEVWDSLNQTAYGYPAPILRVFDAADPTYGDMILDWVSLLMTIWITLLVIFLLLAAIGIILRCTTKKGEQVGAGDAEEAV